MAVIIAPWEADDRPRAPHDFAFGARLPADESADDLQSARDLGCALAVIDVSRERVLQGGDRARPAAIGDVRRRLDAAMARGLRPIVTLGAGDAWLDRDAAPRFAEFAEQVARAVAGAEAVVPVDEPATVALRWAEGGADPVAVAATIASAVRLAGEALRSAAGVRIGASVEIATAFPASSSRDDAAAARFVESSRTHAFLDLAFGRSGLLLSRLAEGAGMSSVQARWLGAVDAAGPAPVDVVVVRPTPPRRAVRAATPLGVQEAPVKPGGWDPSVALLAALLEAPEGVGILVAGTGASTDGDPDGLGAAAEAWRRAALSRPLRGWIAGDLRGDSDFVTLDPQTGRRAVTPLGEALRRIVEAWS